MWNVLSDFAQKAQEAAQQSLVHAKVAVVQLGQDVMNDLLEEGVDEDERKHDERLEEEHTAIIPEAKSMEDTGNTVSVKLPSVVSSAASVTEAPLPPTQPTRPTSDMQSQVNSPATVPPHAVTSSLLPTSSPSSSISSKPRLSALTPLPLLPALRPLPGQTASLDPKPQLSSAQLVTTPPEQPEAAQVTVARGVSAQDKSSRERASEQPINAFEQPIRASAHSTHVHTTCKNVDAETAESTSAPGVVVDVDLATVKTDSVASVKDTAAAATSTAATASSLWGSFALPTLPAGALSSGLSSSLPSGLSSWASSLHSGLQGAVSSAVQEVQAVVEEVVVEAQLLLREGPAEAVEADDAGGTVAATEGKNSSSVGEDTSLVAGEPDTPQGDTHVFNGMTAAKASPTAVFMAPVPAPAALPVATQAVMPEAVETAAYAMEAVPTQSASMLASETSVVEAFTTQTGARARVEVEAVGVEMAGVEVLCSPATDLTGALMATGLAATVDGDLWDTIGAEVATVESAAPLVTETAFAAPVEVSAPPCESALAEDSFRGFSQYFEDVVADIEVAVEAEAMTYCTDTAHTGFDTYTSSTTTCNTATAADLAAVGTVEAHLPVAGAVIDACPVITGDAINDCPAVDAVVVDAAQPTISVSAGVIDATIGAHSVTEVQLVSTPNTNAESPAVTGGDIALAPAVPTSPPVAVAPQLNGFGWDDVALGDSGIFPMDLENIDFGIPEIPEIQEIAIPDEMARSAWDAYMAVEADTHEATGQQDADERTSTPAREMSAVAVHAPEVVVCGVTAVEEPAVSTQVPLHIADAKLQAPAHNTAPHTTAAVADTFAADTMAASSADAMSLLAATAECARLRALVSELQQLLSTEEAESSSVREDYSRTLAQLHAAKHTAAQADTQTAAVAAQLEHCRGELDRVLTVLVARDEEVRTVSQQLVAAQAQLSHAEERLEASVADMVIAEQRAAQADQLSSALSERVLALEEDKAVLTRQLAALSGNELGSRSVDGADGAADGASALHTEMEQELEQAYLALSEQRDLCRVLQEQLHAHTQPQPSPHLQEECLQVTEDSTGAMEHLTSTVSDAEALLATERAMWAARDEERERREALLLASLAEREEALAARDVALEERDAYIAQLVLQIEQLHSEKQQQLQQCPRMVAVCAVSSDADRDTAAVVADITHTANNACLTAPTTPSDVSITSTATPTTTPSCTSAGASTDAPEDKVSSLVAALASLQAYVDEMAHAEAERRAAAKEAETAAAAEVAARLARVRELEEREQALREVLEGEERAVAALAQGRVDTAAAAQAVAETASTAVEAVVNNDSTSAYVAALEAQNAEAREQLQLLSEQHQAVFAHVQALQEQNDLAHAHTQAELAQARAEALEAEVATAATELLASRARVAALTAEATDLRNELSLARAELAAAMAELQQLRTEAAAARGEVTRAQEEVAAATAAAAAARAEVTSVHAAYEQAAEEYRVLGAQYEEARAQNEAIRVACAEAEVASMAAQEEAQRVRAQLAEMEQQREQWRATVEDAQAVTPTAVGTAVNIEGTDDRDGALSSLRAENADLLRERGEMLSEWAKWEARARQAQAKCREQREAVRELTQRCAAQRAATEEAAAQLAAAAARVDACEARAQAAEERVYALETEVAALRERGGCTCGGVPSDGEDAEAAVDIAGIATAASSAIQPTAGGDASVVAVDAAELARVVSAATAEREELLALLREERREREDERALLEMQQRQMLAEREIMEQLHGELVRERAAREELQRQLADNTGSTAPDDVGAAAQALRECRDRVNMLEEALAARDERVAVMAAKQAEAAAAIQHASTLEQQVSSLEARVRTVQNQYRELMALYDTERDAGMDVQERLETVRETSEAEIAALKAEAAQARERCAAVEAELSAAREELAEAAAAQAVYVSESERERGDLRARVSQLSAAVEQVEVETRAAAVVEWGARCEDLSARLAAAEERRDELAAAVTRLEAEAAVAFARQQELVSALAAAEEDAARVRAVEADLRTETAAKDARVGELMAAVQEQAAQVSAMELTLSESKESAAQVSLELRLAQEEAHGLRREAERAQLGLDIATAELEQARAMLAAAQNELVVQGAAATAARDHDAALQASLEVQQLRARAEQAEADAATACETLLALQAEVEGYLAEAGTFAAEREQMQRTCADLQHQHAKELAAREERLAATVGVMQQQLAAAERARAEADGHVQRLVGEVCELQRQLHAQLLADGGDIMAGAGASVHERASELSHGAAGAAVEEEGDVMVVGSGVWGEGMGAAMVTAGAPNHPVSQAGDTYSEKRGDGVGEATPVGGVGSGQLDAVLVSRLMEAYLTRPWHLKSQIEEVLMNVLNFSAAQKAHIRALREKHTPALLDAAALRKTTQALANTGSKLVEGVGAGALVEQVGQVRAGLWRRAWTWLLEDEQEEKGTETVPSGTSAAAHTAAATAVTNASPSAATDTPAASTHAHSLATPVSTSASAPTSTLAAASTASGDSEDGSAPATGAAGALGDMFVSFLLKEGEHASQQAKREYLRLGADTHHDSTAPSTAAGAASAGVVGVGAPGAMVGSVHAAVPAKHLSATHTATHPVNTHDRAGASMAGVVSTEPVLVFAVDNHHAQADTHTHAQAAAYTDAYAGGDVDADTNSDAAAFLDIDLESDADAYFAGHSARGQAFGMNAQYM